MPTLNWIGKDAVVRHHEDVPYRLLEPVPELSHTDPNAPDDSGNLIVQGDNLHALKALLPRYAGQVKCIYIDPPYNTGNEGWVYNDNVNSPEIRQWLHETVGKEGEDLSRHDKWLCMMYPRLVLLKQFLSDDGAIFVSIDDDEIHHLRSLMDEIFGRNRRMATFSWRTAGNFDNQAKIKISHEYILMYSLQPEIFPHPPVVDPSTGEQSKLNRPEIRNTIVKNGPKNPISNVVLPLGFPADFDEGEIQERNQTWPHIDKKITVSNGKLSNEVTVRSGWSSKRLLENFIAAGMQPVRDTKNQLTRFVLTSNGAIESIKKRETPSHVISSLTDFGSTQAASADLAHLGISFSYPKPVELISYLISLIYDKECLVLDSFAGSGTTGDALLKQNAEDGGNRKFILVEMDENIAGTVTAERIRRVASGYTNAKGTPVAGLGGSFQYCRLSDAPLFNATGAVRDDVRFDQLAEFVWFSETGSGFAGQADSPLIGVDADNRAIYLLYNGILKDRTAGGGNVLTHALLAELPAHDGPKVIYAAACRIGERRLAAANIVFKQTPYAIGV
ncbi:site-specific DNA-methyltransferase [Salinisphaera sp.]|uniref:site-specific DNA-methyltransferase n=1 Tax=Salinisphaera sp. TaxID=1914330 RepID=UPI000C3AF891|nr:site-specific DNA-methyltransferase [Salinisphaera sp.]MAS09023.1 site-specific DNA-methyltransferase [Salinisphaera sp.]